MGFVSNSIQCIGPHGFHRMAYTDWGAPAAERVLFCVHGLTRNGRDFDYLAAALEDRYRTLCPDIAGRGKSARLSHSEDYNNRQYVADVIALFARSGTERIDWLGTSMGGMMGMITASMPESPIRRLILNDIGPWLPKAALQRIADYVGSVQHFDDKAGVEGYLRTVHEPFGALTDDQWRHLAEHSSYPRDDGGYELACDPKIGDAFQAMAIDDVDLWALWDRIECPVLVLRGIDSDLLSADVAKEMASRGPKADVVEIEGCGHAPALMDGAQIATVRDWLLG